MLAEAGKGRGGGRVREEGMDARKREMKHEKRIRERKPGRFRSR